MKKSHWFGLVIAAILIIVSVVLITLNILDNKLFFFILGVSLVVAGLPFLVSLVLESQEERTKEQMFLEFTRDLVEGVKSGTPISKSILNVKTKNYGPLSKHIEKLANQIYLGIPIKDALQTFSKDVKSVVISRAIVLISEAERAGGRIESILESVAASISQIEKLRKERKAAVYNLAVQGYIIFIIFIVIMLVMQFKILPITNELNTDALQGGDVSGLGFGNGLGGGAESSMKAEDMSKAFLFLLITQGFFAGLVIGKISEGKLKAGLKHSFILVALSWLISSGANAFLT